MSWDVFYKNRWRALTIGTILALSGCDNEPVTRGQADAHSRAYDVCAHQARTGKELANCAFAVSDMK